ALLVIGVGLGLNTAPVNGVAVAALPPQRSGTASGVLNTSRMIGATLGDAILGAAIAVLVVKVSPPGAGVLPGRRAAWSRSAGVELIGGAVGFPFIRRDSLHPKK